MKLNWKIWTLPFPITYCNCIQCCLIFPRRTWFNLCKKTLPCLHSVRFAHWSESIANFMQNKKQDIRRANVHDMMVFSCFLSHLHLLQFFFQLTFYSTAAVDLPLMSPEMQRRYRVHWNLWNRPNWTDAELCCTMYCTVN